MRTVTLTVDGNQEWPETVGSDVSDAEAELTQWISNQWTNDEGKVVPARYNLQIIDTDEDGNEIMVDEADLFVAEDDA